jgi:WD40 repeat protein
VNKTAITTALSLVALLALPHCAPTPARAEERKADVRSRPDLVISHNGRVNVLACSADGRVIASEGAKDDIRVSDPATGKLIRHVLTPGFTANSLALSHDGALLAAGCNDGKVRVWATKPPAQPGEAPGRTEAPAPLHTLEVTRWSIFAVAFSPGGDRVAACGADGTVQVWALGEKLARLRILGAPGERMRSLAFSPDGRRLASLTRFGKVDLWDVDSGRPLGSLPGQEGDVSGTVWFSNDNATLVVARAGGIDFWQLRDGDKPAAVRVVRSVQLPDASARRDAGNPNARGPVVRIEAQFAGVTALSPDLKTAAVVNRDGSITLWDAENWEPLRTLTGERSPEIAGGGVEAISFTAGGKRLVAANYGGHVEVWKLE